MRRRHDIQHRVQPSDYRATHEIGGHGMALVLVVISHQPSAQGLEAYGEVVADVGK